MEMSRIRTRLRSEQGATLIYALFFFIICAVVGSVVLTAGTAAAGRLSQAQKMDQRYFAVNSAAEMLEWEMNQDAARVTVVTKSQSKDTITSTLTKAGEKWNEGERSRSRTPVGEPATTTSGTSAPIAALLLDAVNLADNTAVTNKTIQDIELSCDAGDTLKTMGDLGVDAKYNITITLRDTIGDKPNQRYYLTLDCPAHIATKTDVQEKTTEVKVEGTGDTRTRNEKRDVTTTVTKTITWSVAATMKGKGA